LKQLGFIAFAMTTAMVTLGPVHAAVGISDRTGAEIAVDKFAFADEAGHTVALGSYFHSGRPVVLTLVYFGCPGLCTVTLSNLVNTLKYVNPSPGKGFEVVAISIDAKEKPSLALAKKASYLKQYARPETAQGWHFLTGDEDTIQRLAASLGFQYERDEKTGIIKHPSALFIMNADGKLTSAFSALNLTHRELRVALFDVEKGRVKALVSRLWFSCSSLFR
jgi:protein SCO1/2